jgi:hypothetical protein
MRRSARFAIGLWSNGSVPTRTFDQDGNVTQITSSVLKTYFYEDVSRITGITDPM